MSDLQELVVQEPLPVVFIVDDDADFRAALRALVESVGLQARTFGSATDFLDAYDETPGCLVLDVRMPGLSGLDLQAELSARGVAIPIIMMSAFPEVPVAVRAMRAGAVDFIQKPVSPQDLLDRVHEAIRADLETRQQEEARAVLEERLARLTPRQRVVLDGILAGKPSKAIAAEMGLSPKTVDVHRARLMARLGARSLPDLFRLLRTAS